MFSNLIDFLQTTEHILKHLRIFLWSSSGTGWHQHASQSNKWLDSQRPSTTCSDRSRRSIRLHWKLFSPSACSLLLSLRNQHPFNIFPHHFDSVPEVDRSPPTPTSSVTTSDYGCRNISTSAQNLINLQTFKKWRIRRQIGFFNHIWFFHQGAMELNKMINKQTALIILRGAVGYKISNDLDAGGKAGRGQGHIRPLWGKEGSASDKHVNPSECFCCLKIPPSFAVCRMSVIDTWICILKGMLRLWDKHEQTPTCIADCFCRRKLHWSSNIQMYTESSISSVVIFGTSCSSFW